MANSLYKTIGILEKRIAIYSSALNMIDDYFEYKCISGTDKKEVFTILTNLATTLRDHANGSK